MFIKLSLATTVVKFFTSTYAVISRKWLIVAFVILQQNKKCSYSKMYHMKTSIPPSFIFRSTTSVLTFYGVKLINLKQTDNAIAKNEKTNR